MSMLTFKMPIQLWFKKENNINDYSLLYFDTQSKTPNGLNILGDSTNRPNRLGNKWVLKAYSNYINMNIFLVYLAVRSQ